MVQDIFVSENRVMAMLKGSLYVEEAGALRSSLISYLDRGFYNFVIDLAGVDYIDSSGLGVLVAIHKRALQNGGTVKLRGLRGTVKELFELTRLSKVFDIE